MLASETSKKISLGEVIYSAVSRIFHSNGYRMLYFVLTVSSFMSLFLAIVERCPSTAYYLLESFTCVLMILEISIRIISFNKGFFNSYGNIADLVLVLSTSMMLVYLATTVMCEEDGRFISETGGILSLLRNIIQFIRAASLIKKGAERDIFFVDSAAEDRRLNMDLQTGKDERETFKWISGKLSWKAPGTDIFDHSDECDL